MFSFATLIISQFQNCLSEPLICLCVLIPFHCRFLMSQILSSLTVIKATTIIASTDAGECYALIFVFVCLLCGSLLLSIFCHVFVVWVFVCRLQSSPRPSSPFAFYALFCICMCCYSWLLLHCCLPIWIGVAIGLCCCWFMLIHSSFMFILLHKGISIKLY